MRILNRKEKSDWKKWEQILVERGEAFIAIHKENENLATVCGSFDKETATKELKEYGYDVTGHKVEYGCLRLEIKRNYDTTVRYRQDQYSLPEDRYKELGDTSIYVMTDKVKNLEDRYLAYLDFMTEYDVINLLSRVQNKITIMNEKMSGAALYYDSDEEDRKNCITRFVLDVEAETSTHIKEVIVHSEIEIYNNIRRLDLQVVYY